MIGKYTRFKCFGFGLEVELENVLTITRFGETLLKRYAVRSFYMHVLYGEKNKRKNSNIELESGQFYLNYCTSFTTLTFLTQKKQQKNNNNVCDRCFYKSKGACILCFPYLVKILTVWVISVLCMI